MVMLELALLATFASAETVAAFGPGEAAAHSHAGPSTRQPPLAGHADFKVLIWYRRVDPLGTFKYQVYDIRKGEFTAEVESWVKAVETKYAGYAAIVRDVDLKREKGQTEQLKVGSVIMRELTVAAAMSGADFGGSVTIGPGPSYSAGGPAARMGARPGSVSNDRSFLNPPPTSFPVPVPYPRPVR
jgi:hypothetical protein